MSTRGVYGFRIGGQDKVTYNHSDSYPSWLGTSVVAWVRAHALPSMRLLATRLELVDDDDPPSPEQASACVVLGTSDVVRDWWPALLRQAQGDLSFWDKGLRYLIDSHEFLADSLLCEWAYIINLDSEMLEVYRGWNQSAVAPGRYARLMDDDPEHPFYGVALVRELPIAILHEMNDAMVADFIDTLDPSEEAGAV